MTGGLPKRQYRQMPYILVLLLLVPLLSNCSGIKAYSNSLNKNLTLKTKTESGSVFSSLNVSLHIHSVDNNCQTGYQGTVKASKGKTAVGLPVGRASYLIFRFDSSSFWANSSSSTSYETLLTPRRGYNYVAKLSYADDIYNVEIEERSRRNSRPRIIESRELSRCR